MSEAAAVASGDPFGDYLVNVETTIQSIGVSAASQSAAAGEFKVDLGELVSFYNQLYRLHLQVSQQAEAVRSRSIAIATASVSGGVTGVHEAWTAVVDAAGGAEVHQSLVASLQELDGRVRKFLFSLHDCFAAYVKADQGPAATFHSISGQLS